MSTDKRYNGWANYETWNVALWLDNDQGSHEYWRERAEEIFRDATPGEYDWQTRAAEATTELAEALKNEHEENAPELSGTFADLLSAALSCVDWHEIAGHYIDDVAAEVEAEEREEASND